MTHPIVVLSLDVHVRTMINWSNIFVRALGRKGLPDRFDETGQSGQGQDGGHETGLSGRK